MRHVRLNRKNVSWTVYKNGILHDPVSEIRKIKYQSSAKEYQDDFDTLLSRVDVNDEHVLFTLVVLVEQEEEFVDAYEVLSAMETEEVQPQISLNALSRVSSYQTLRVVRLFVNGQELHILVDSGSTHNFLDTKMAKRLGCAIRPTCPLIVNVAGEKQLLSVSECIHWLSTLGDIKSNLKDLRIEFVYNNKKMVLRGTHKSKVQWAEDKDQLHKMEGTPQAEMFMLCVYPNTYLNMSASGEQRNDKVLKPGLTQIMEKFSDVFEVSHELPPKRSHDHRIPLIPSNPPVNIRPYRHPPIQKDAIENMVKELLESGVIKPRQSPFSSPIVMVKKKDNTWRMCVDYRQLNKSTIKDKFPIPIINELIDELHSVVVFSKLDLRTRSLLRRPRVFGTSQVEYLGHAISAQGVATNPKTDASGVGIGAVLQQNRHPIAYLSKTLAPKHQTLSIYEKEFLAIMMALEKWRGYLLDSHFIIKTDHYSLSSVGGHSEVKVTTHMMSSMLYWKGMRKDIKKIVYECINCQRNKPDLAVDMLTKYAHFIPLSHPFTFIEVAQEFLDTVNKLHGLPTFIVLNMDKVFLSNFWKELFKLLQVKLLISTAYHPYLDGQTEVVNRCLECYLRCMTGERTKEWKKWLSLAELWYISNFYTSIQTTSFEAVYGQSPPVHVTYLGGLSKLKLCQGYPPLSQVMKLPSCNKEGLMKPEPIALLDRKMVKRNNAAVVYGLIQWDNGSKDDDT
nr:hypothetical protein [Tanacetum cinerariifolium]